ncbi:hypothetical protein OZ671_28890, partial [Phreatobacter sp. AB_2022a]|nr:hypothetical protein [Phreatobacter sp. AB_2022a]
MSFEPPVHLRNENWVQAMSLPGVDVNAMLKDGSRTFRAAEELAGPAVAAAVLPMTVAMTGWVAFWGVGMGLMRAFAPGAAGPRVRREPEAAPAPVRAPHLTVVPEVAAPKPAKAAAPKVVKAKVVKPEVVKPEPAKPEAVRTEARPVPAKAKTPAAKVAVAKPVAAKAAPAKAVAPAPV